MTAEDEQTLDDDEAQSDDDAEAQLYDTVNSPISRRNFLKGTAAAAGAAAVGASPSTIGTASAQDSGDLHKAPDSLKDVAINYAMQHKASRNEASTMMLTTPVARTLHTTADTVDYAVSKTAKWAFGSVWGDDNPDERQHEQLALDVNAHCRTIRDNLEAMVKQNYDNFKMLNNNALIAGEVAAVKAIKAGKSETQVAADAQAEIENMISVYEENFYRIIESAIVRVVNLRKQQVSAYGDDPDWNPTVVYERDVNADWYDRPIGTRDMEVQLVNGEVITTQCLVLANGTDSAGVAYAHPLFNFSGKIENYQSLQEDGDTFSHYTGDFDGIIPQICETSNTYDKEEIHGLRCLQYDSNNPEVSVFSEGSFIFDVTTNGSARTGWKQYINEHVLQRRDTLVSDMQQYVSDLFSALASGEIENVEEVMSPYAYSEMMAGDWLNTGSTGFAAGAAHLGGYSTDVERTGEYTHVDSDAENTTYTESNLIWDSENPPNLGDYTSEELGSGDWTVTVPIGSGSTFHLDTYSGKQFSASHASESVDGIGVQLGTGDSSTPVTSGASSSITPSPSEWESALSEHGVAHGDTVEIGVEVTTGTGSSTTVSATSVTVLIETRLQVGSEYTVPSSATVYIADEQGMHEVSSGDAVRVESVQDADGNALDYIAITGDTLVTLDDTSDVQEQWDNILDAQNGIENGTPEGSGDPGPAGGGGFNLGSGDALTWVMVFLGGATGLGVLAQLLSDDEPPRGGRY